MKVTCAQRETLAIAGFALDGEKWDGLYLGRRKGDDLIYAGKVDHGCDDASAAELRERLTPLIRESQPYANRIAHRGIWVEPELSARSNTGPSPPKERCGIRYSRAYERTCEEISCGTHCDCCPCRTLPGKTSGNMPGVRPVGVLSADATAWRIGAGIKLVVP